MIQVEPHGLKPVAPPHALSGGTLRSKPYYAPFGASKGTLLTFIHGLKTCGFLRRRVKNVAKNLVQ